MTHNIKLRGLFSNIDHDIKPYIDLGDIVEYCGVVYLVSTIRFGATDFQYILQSNIDTKYIFLTVKELYTDCNIDNLTIKNKCSDIRLILMSIDIHNNWCDYFLYDEPIKIKYWWVKKLNKILKQNNLATLVNNQIITNI